MPLIPFADIASLPQQARDAYERLPKKLNIFRMWANAPEMFVAGLRLGGNILARQKLDARCREMLILLAAKLEGGAYEWVQHVPIAEGVGCSAAQIAALDECRFDAACFDAGEQALLRFAREVICDVKASKAALEAVKAHFSSQEIVEAIFTCGFYMMLARLTETTEVEIDESGGMAVLSELGRMG